MNDKDLDKLLREKAKEFEVKDYTKQDVDEIRRIAKKKRKGVIIKRSIAVSLCACLCVAVLVYFTLFRTTNNTAENNTNVVNEGKEEVDIDYSNVVGTYIYSSSDDALFTDKMASDIFVVKIIEVNNEGIVNGIPKSLINAEIVEKLKGKNMESVTFNLYSCYIKISECPNEVKEEIGTVESENDVVKLIMSENMESVSDPEVGKYYVVSLLETNGEYETVDNSIYCFNEFNLETRQVKIGDEWETLNLDYIL